LALTLLTSASAGVAERPECASQGRLDFARKADLPSGVLEAFGMPMAERGAPFQSTDLLGPGPALPGTRFVAARQENCRLALRFEQGGIAHTWQTANLERHGDRWVLLRRRLD
jgi:hypothetical protein